VNIAILLYDGMTALDAIGPYEALRQLPGARVEFVGQRAGEIVCDSKVLGLQATRSISDVGATDILVVPGGPGSRDLRSREPLIEWIRDIHPTTQWTTSVCTGAILLGLAGVLDRIRATTHWAFMDSIAELGAIPVKERFVRSGKIVTAAGVSAGIDMALWLIGEIAGREAAERVQLTLEYDPQPPFDSGRPDKAPPAVLEAAILPLRRTGLLNSQATAPPQ
jgi:putative intracellular protease/amidase